MRIAIMQPYLFPYVGYFQLIASVDKFVFYDDVNFIKGGWINRNRILLNGQPHYFTIPLAGASPHRKICEIGVDDRLDWVAPMRKSFTHAYGRFESFGLVESIFESTLGANHKLIGELAKESILQTCKVLGVGAMFEMTSSVYRNTELRGASRVIDICIREGATEYVNLPGGRRLYSEAEFAEAGIELKFLDPILASYPQRTPHFVSALSILDVIAGAGFGARGHLLLDRSQ